MNLSILHISDLHRDPGNPIGNQVLLDSLQNDLRHYSSEETPLVRPPDLIVVSGDIVHGVHAEARDAEHKLREQYQEAIEFLGRLTDLYVNGDRNRVIVVPGNHDVNAYLFMKSLHRIDIVSDRKKELVAQLFSPGSLLRWSWAGFDLYEIADQIVYAERLAAFAEFYASFYGGTRMYDLDPTKQMDIFDFPAFDITVAGFSSCHNNDLLNRVGAINPTCIADAGSRLRQPCYRDRLRIAVWHHNTEAPPPRADCMDPDVVQNLIDRGFSLGLHGHQHRPQFLDTKFRHGIERKITVISAGTLCGAASFRHGRAYNLIELDTGKRMGRLHVREMQNDNLNLPIWGRRSLHPNTRSFYDFSYDPPPEPAVRSNASTTQLTEAQRFYEMGDYRRAADVLVRVAPIDDLARPLLLDCLVKLKDTPVLIAIFDPPASDAEAIHLMDALWAEGRRDRLHALLQFPLIANSTDPSVSELRNKYAVRLSR